MVFITGHVLVGIVLVHHVKTQSRKINPTYLSVVKEAYKDNYVNFLFGIEH